MSDVKPVVTPYMTRIHELITEYRDATTVAKKQRARKAIVECVGARDAALQAEIERFKETDEGQLIINNAVMWSLEQFFSVNHEGGPIAAAKNLADTIERAGKHIAAQQAEIEALRKDAERYRWLRHGDNDELVIHYGDDASEFDTWLPRTDDLDLTIDAAIAKEKQQEILK